MLYFKYHGQIATAPPLCGSWSDHTMTSLWGGGGTFQTDTNPANHSCRTKLLALRQ